MKQLLAVIAIAVMLTTATMYELLPVQATVNEDSAANRYAANGSTTVYTYTFRILSKNEIEVLVDSVTKTVDVDYVVSGVASATGGSITFNSAPANNTTVTLLRKQTASQANTYFLNEPFPSTRVEKDFDRLVMHVQQLKERLDRALTFAKASTLTAQTVDTPTAGLFARAKAGGGIDWATPTNAGALSSPVGVSDGGTGATTAAGARANLLDYTENTLIDAKGDILVGQFDNSVARLPAPSTLGMVPQWGNSGTVGITWAAQQQVNPIINGSMDLWQRGGSFALAVTGTYTADRWAWKQSGGGQVTISRSTDVPTVASANLLLNYSLEVAVPTADTSIAASDLYAVYHRIEGYNWRPFAQRPFVLSFWVRDTTVGTHAVSFSNSGEDRTYLATYTINVTNTWEYKTVPVSASPSAGSWNYISGVGLAIRFNMAAGANFDGTGSENTWAANNAYSNASTVNSMASTSNLFRVTGIKLELGTVATPMQFIPFEQELARAQRYYEKSFNYAEAPRQNAGNSTGEYYFGAYVTGAVAMESQPIQFATRKRTLPTVLTYNYSAANAQVRNVTDSADLSGAAVNSAMESHFSLTMVGSAGTAPGETLAVHWTADAEL